MKCFFHAADLDGHCSGALVKLWYSECEMFPIDYGDPFPWKEISRGEEIFMVDFSLQPFDEMLDLDRICHLTWIDHHVSAIKEYEAVLDSGYKPRMETILSKDERAACELVADYIVPVKNQSSEMFFVTRALGRYDVWDKQGCGRIWDSIILPFQYGMRLRDTMPTTDNAMLFWENILMMDDGPCGYETITDVAEILERKFDFMPASVCTAADVHARDIVNEGRVILQYKAQESKTLCKQYSTEVVLDGLRCIAINAPRINSETFESVWNPLKYDAMLSYYWRNDQWSVVLFTDKPEIDLSEICKAHGGGGHKGAAGFQCDELPWDPLLEGLQDLRRANR